MVESRVEVRSLKIEYALKVGYRSGQTGQTVNLLANTFEGSNPSPTTIFVKVMWQIGKAAGSVGVRVIPKTGGYNTAPDWELYNAGSNPAITFIFCYCDVIGKHNRLRACGS